MHGAALKGSSIVKRAERRVRYILHQSLAASSRAFSIFLVEDILRVTHCVVSLADGPNKVVIVASPRADEVIIVVDFAVSPGTLKLATLRMVGRCFSLRGHLRDVLLVDVLVHRNLVDIIHHIVLVLHEVGRLVLLLETVSLAECVLLGRRVAILAHEDADGDEDEDDEVEDAEPAEHHIGVILVERLRHLQIHDAAGGREAHDCGHDDATDHFGDAFGSVALHRDNDHETGASLEDSQEVSVPTGWVFAEHVGDHDDHLEDQHSWHDYFG